MIYVVMYDSFKKKKIDIIEVRKIVFSGTIERSGSSRSTNNIQMFLRTPVSLVRIVFL